MKKLVLLVLLSVFSSSLWSAASVPETLINHAYVKGVYWNPSQLPGWGFIVDVQEEMMFGAIYGYMGSDSTFIILQGNVTSSLPLTFRGDVFFVTGGGSASSDVGNFTWIVEDHEAAPSAKLTITSNILNRTNLNLIRFSYVEDDKVDMFTAADWNIVRRILGVTFGDHYGIFDDRVVEDGTTYALVADNTDLDKIGVIAYYSDNNGYTYAMLLPFTDGSNVFYVFLANDIEMYGRYWLLEEGENPSGNGNYFRGSADTMQASNQTLMFDQPGLGTAGNNALNEAGAVNDNRRREIEVQDEAPSDLDEMFPRELVQRAYVKTLRLFESRLDRSKE